MKKRVVSLCICLMVILSLQIISFAESSEIKVFLNGQQIYFDVAPQLINDRTMVPMRTIFEAFNATVNWDDNTQTVTAVADNKNIKLTIGSSAAYINGNGVALDTPAQIVNGRTLVPLRFVGEALDSEVNWHSEISAVSIYKNVSSKRMVTMYDLWAVSHNIDAILVNEYRNLGWSENISEVQTNVFSAYNGVKVIGKAEVEQYLSEGWTLTPPSLNFLSNPSGFFEKNFVNGIDVYWGAKNTSGKTINYYTVHYTFLNPVGDPAYDEITHKPTKTIKTVGPIQPNKSLIVATTVGYVPTCDTVRIDLVELEFADGSTDSIWCGQTINSIVSSSDQLEILNKISK